MSTKAEKHQITVHGLVVDVVRKDIKNLHLQTMISYVLQQDTKIEIVN